MATMNDSRKYYALYRHICENGGNEITLTFDEIEQLLDDQFPPTARTHRAWWSNRRTGAAQADAWMEAGYHVSEVDFTGERVTFRKPAKVYHVQRKAGQILWDGELIKTLRRHMGFSQTELATELGVRQQTISEWETGMYLPKRAMSKLLSFVAERAGFTYSEEEAPKPE